MTDDVNAQLGAGPALTGSGEQWDIFARTQSRSSLGGT